MSHIDDRATGSRQGREDVEQALGLLEGQRRRRLVEDKNSRVHRKRFCNSYELLLVDRQARTILSGSMSRPTAARYFFARFLDAAPRDQTEASSLTAKSIVAY